MIGIRIKELRKVLNLTQQEFSDRLGIKRNTIAKYETGRGDPINAVISLICREFDVSEDWLRNGIGEMFVTKPCDTLDSLAFERGLSVGSYAIIRRFLELRPEIQDAFVNFAVNVANDIFTGVEPTPPWYVDDEPNRPVRTWRLPEDNPADQHAAWEAEARAEAEQVYREVLAEKRAEAGLSASPSGSAEGVKGA